MPLGNAAALAASVGARVRTLREAAGITQEKLAWESGLRSKGTLSKIESGQQLPSLSVMEFLARRLGVELLDLLIQPGQDNPRHNLVELTRRLSAHQLRELARPFSSPDSARAQPFTEAPRPHDDAHSTRVLPLIGLDVAAGGFDVARVDRGTRWVRPHTTRRLHAGCFVARVVGRSMEPTIPDGAWAVFTRRVSDDPRGKVVIAQYGGLVDVDTAASYTVKRFRATAAAHGSESRWSEVSLEPDNAAFAPIVVQGARLGDLSIVAELVEVLLATGTHDEKA